MLKGIKEQYLNNPLFPRPIPIVISVWILSLTAYYCINTPWLELFNSGRPDTKLLIVETLKFQWVPVFLPRLLYVFYALILNFIALLIGNRILRWLKVDFDSNLNKIIFSVPLGWGIYSIGIFYLGILGLLYVEAVYLFLTFLGILSILEIGRFFRKWKARATPTLPSPLEGEGARFKLDKTDLIFLPVIITFITVQLVASLNPEWWIGAMSYHPMLQKLYVKRHALVHVHGYVFSTFPAHIDMLYLLGLITSGEPLSKLLSFSISLVFLISIFSFGNKYFSKGTGYLAAVIMPLSVPPFLCVFSECLVDAALGLFSLLGVYAFFMWIGERREGYLYLSIICCASATATKIHGLFFVLLFFAGFLVTLTLLLPFEGEGRMGGRQLLKKLAWCMLAVGIIALPWYIRSWWLTGDPVSPFLYNYLGGRYWNEYSNACFWEHHSLPAFRGVKSFSDFIRINKVLFSPGYSFISFSLIIFIFLIPALIMPRKWNKLMKYLFFVILVYYIFFIFTSPMVRYFYAGLAILSIIVAHFIITVWTKYLITRIPIVLCFVVFSIVAFLHPLRWIEGSFFIGLGVINQRQFFMDENYKASVWVNENLPQDSKILTWHLQGYHLNREYVLADPTFQGVLDFGRINDAQTFLKSIKELGITHLIHNPIYQFGSHDFLNRYVFELLEGSNITPLNRIGGSVVYSLTATLSDYFVLDGNAIRFWDESHRKYLAKGWSSTEEWGTWSEGEESVILVNFKKLKEILRSAQNDKEVKDYTMLIKATGFSVPGKQQSVRIYLDDNLLGEHTFTHPTTYFEGFEIKIPSAYIKEGNQRLRFVYNFTGVPAEHDMGPDLRQLAMGVSSIEFK